MINRNDPCPCGSGKKFKKCCMGKGGVAAPPGPGPAKKNAPGIQDLVKQADSYHRAGRLKAAARLYADVLERRPKDGAALLGLAQVQRQRGMIEESAGLFRRAIAAGRNDASVHLRLGQCLSLIGQVEEALRYADRAISMQPDLAQAHILRALCNEQLNKTDRAVECIARAIALGPEGDEAYLTRARLLRRTGKLGEARAELERLLETAEGGLRAALLHEHAHVLDRLGSYDAAWKAAAAAGAEDRHRPGAEQLEPALLSRRIVAYRERVTRDLMTRWSVETLADDQPPAVFVVGFPRSGTTMTEQILAAHADLLTSNESPVLRPVRQMMSRMIDVPESEGVPTILERLDVEQVRELRALYWRTVRETMSDDLEGKVFINKNPLNIVEAGLIATLFPEARFVVVLRDPRDACLSCFMQDFQLNAGMINFLTAEGTVRFYTEAMALWLHMREILPTPYIEIRYEDTVADLEPTARRLLEFIGVDWDPEVLRFHEQARKRFISTPSYAAVTTKVNTKAIGRWRNYRTQFGGLLEELQPFVDEFGYGD